MSSNGSWRITFNPLVRGNVEPEMPALEFPKGPIQFAALSAEFYLEQETSGLNPFRTLCGFPRNLRHCAVGAARAKIRCSPGRCFAAERRSGGCSLSAALRARHALLAYHRSIGDNSSAWRDSKRARDGNAKPVRGRFRPQASIAPAACVGRSDVVEPKSGKRERNGLERRCRYDRVAPKACDRAPLFTPFSSRQAAAFSMRQGYRRTRISRI